MNVRLIRENNILPIGNFWVNTFYLATTLGAVGSILARIFTRSVEKREARISRGFKVGIGLGIGISVFLPLVVRILPQ